MMEQSQSYNGLYFVLMGRLSPLDGIGPEEVCNILAISETNQRVLLHRARMGLRAALEVHLRRG